MPQNSPASNPPAPKKIAILGGGVGAMTTAFGLTNQPNWQDEYELTIYQMGWRLGGKGASGRNAQHAQRIEEHGLHIWYGFYDNAFRLIQQCYQELNRPATAPMHTWEQAFKPHQTVLIQEFHNQQWKPWPLDFPSNAHLPGQSERYLSLLGYTKQLLHWVFHLADELVGFGVTKQSQKLGRLKTAFKHLGRDLDLADLKVGTTLLQAARRLADRLDFDVPAPSATPRFQALARLLKALRQAMWAILKNQLDSHDDLRRTWILFELATVNAYGLLVDGVILSGFQAVDAWDYRAWLQRHGASDMAVNSAPIQALYDVAMAYPHGKTLQADGLLPAGNLSAGVALHATLLILFAYKGAILWKMQAGMGDVVFAPLYQLLKRRGVKFEFFHKVSDLHLSPDHSEIETIVINRQATLAEGQAEYDPLIEVKGLPCWPSKPLYAQLEQGPALKEAQVNLESAWSTWPGVDEIRLERGQDFDVVVLGISIGALPALCGSLAEANPAWQAMLQQVKTVPTQSLQLWLKPSLKDLGWAEGEPILDAYAQPFNTWSAMTQTRPWEAWPPDNSPGHIAYFCGPLAEPETDSDQAEETPQKAQAQVKETATAWLHKNIAQLWPNATHPETGFNWDLLLDASNAQGEARFEAQYWRANIDPSERYVLSVAGSSRYRLQAGESGFANLYLAGDWTQNGLNVGCVEAAVISGLQAAEAISGLSQHIIGDLDIWYKI